MVLSRTERPSWNSATAAQGALWALAAWAPGVIVHV